MSLAGPLVQRRTLGDWPMHAIQAGGQKLDGGAMFGVVPKVLWERRIPADERNRIQLGMRCLLVEHPSELVLIDTGAGNKEPQKFYEIYGIENRGSDDRTLLEDGIRAAGFSPEDVSLVINSHLHFDHAGGNTYRDADGVIRPALPNARYVVQQGEHEFACTANERTSASYFPHNFEPLLADGRLERVRGERELLPGVRLVPTPGHTPHHQGILLESAGERAFYAADLIPTAAHLPLPWIMGYDVEPLVTLETKRHILRRAVDEQWLVVFEHDAEVGWGRVALDKKGYALAKEP